MTKDKAALHTGQVTEPSFLPQGGTLIFWNSVREWDPESPPHAASGLRTCQPVGPAEHKDWLPPHCGRQAGGRYLAASVLLFNRPDLENNDIYPWQWRIVWNTCTWSVGEQLLNWKLCILPDAPLPPPPFSLLLPSPLCLWEFPVLSLYTLIP